MPSSQISCGIPEGRESESVRERLAVQSGGTHDSEYQASPAGKIAEAASHLRVALLQSHPDDDQIILGHVREALKLLEEK